MATVDVGLAPVVVGVEDDGVEIDPPVSIGYKLDANGTPVGLHDKAEKSEGFDGCRLMVGVDGQVEVPMGTCLATRERIDTPAASDPCPAAGAREGLKHD